MAAYITELDVRPGRSEDEAVLVIAWNGDASLIEINWGDNSPVESLLPDDSGRITESHDYTGKPGTHHINVTVHDDSESPSTGVIIIDVVDRSVYEAELNYLNANPADFRSFEVFSASASGVATASASSGSAITYNESVADIAEAQASINNVAAGYLSATVDDIAMAVATVDGEIDHTSVFVVANEPNCPYGNLPFDSIVPRP